MKLHATAAIGMLFALCLPLSSKAAAPDVTAAQAAATILAARGRPVVVVFMRSTCSRCQAFMPVFNKFATEQLDRKVRVLVFAIDHKKEELDKYLAESRLTLNVAWIRPFEKGELSKALEPTGVQIGSSFGLPLVAVLDAKGKNLGQWEGMSPSGVTSISDALK